MKNLFKFTIYIALTGGIMLFTGCAVYPAHYHDEGYGPPPHAPANGYRYKYQGHDFVYDANLGVYIIMGYTDYYFLDNFYYRYRNNGWYYSKKFDRNWQQYKKNKLPPGLVKKYRDRDRPHDRDDGRGKDYGHDGGHGHDRD